MKPQMPTAGTYIVAVSGGVDSMTLLDLLHAQSGLRLIVAHYDHGIRADSYIDKQLVEAAAANYGLPFVSAQGKLGSGASEAQAREARYAFLRKVMQEEDATAIITAHHQDDLLETVAHNLIRGTGRTGLSALRTSTDIVRPLLAVTKSQILEYATAHELSWRDDSTNFDTKYTRNYLRHEVLATAGQANKKRLLAKTEKAHSLNQEIDALLTEYLMMNSQRGRLKRQPFIMLPHQVAAEVMIAWLRSHQIRNFDKKTIERLILAAKTFQPGKQVPVIGGVMMQVGKHDLALHHHER